MRKIIFSLSFCLIASLGLNAQEKDVNKEEPVKKETVKKVKKDKPVRSPWNSGILMGSKTSVVPNKGSIRFDLAHNFGSMENGGSDLLGIYAPAANVRMGLSYVPIKNLEVGIGITKFNITTDLNAKWTIFEQTRKNKMPVSITVLGNIAIDGIESDVFGTEYTFADRFSYFSQFLVGRKFNKSFSIQAGVGFSHFNSAAENVNHDIISMHFGGKVRITPTISFIANTDIPLDIEGISEYTNPEIVARPNIQGGIELITPTHAFQIYVGTANEILPQNIVMYNINDFNLEGIRFGFILTKL